MFTMLSISALIIILACIYLYTQREFKFGPLQRAWIDSLRAHPERQVRGILGRQFGNDPYKACCLGEAGVIANVCKWETGRLWTINGSSSQTLNGVYDAIGLRGPYGNPKSKKHASLAILNDGGSTWPEIADILERHPRMYFTCSK